MGPAAIRTDCPLTVIFVNWDYNLLPEPVRQQEPMPDELSPGSDPWAAATLMQKALRRATADRQRKLFLAIIRRPLGRFGNAGMRLAPGCAGSQIAARARFRSAIKSASASSPTESRTRPSVMPAASRASGVIPACVIVTG